MKLILVYENINKEIEVDPLIKYNEFCLKVQDLL